MIKFAFTIARGIAADQRVRRRVMLWLIGLAVALLFSGATFLWPHLEKLPLVFVGYWLTCAWLTLTAMLLAAYDILCVIRKGREDRQNTRRRIFKDLP